jgi:RNA polymerase sigma-54 factor
MALSQSLQQKLLQRLSPQQIQLMKLLQIPTANLEERIKEELEENPALEVTEEGKEDGYEENHQDDIGTQEEEEEYDGSEDEYENIDISDYVSDSDDEVADYKLRDDNYGDNEEQKTIPLRVETTLHDLLINQLGMLSLDER